MAASDEVSCTEDTDDRQPKIRETPPCVVYMIYMCIGYYRLYRKMNQYEASQYHHISCTCPRYPQKIHGFPATQSCDLTISALSHFVWPPICHDVACRHTSIFENCKKIHGKAQKKDMWDVSNTSKSWCFWHFSTLMIVPQLGDPPMQPPSFKGKWLSMKVEPSKQGSQMGSQLDPTKLVMLIVT